MKDQKKELEVKRGWYIAKDRVVLEITGEDRKRYLQSLLSNDLESLAQGQFQYSALLTVKSRLLADLVVYNASDRFLLDCPAEKVNDIEKILDQYIIADDVELKRPEKRTSVIRVITNQTNDPFPEKPVATLKDASWNAFGRGKKIFHTNEMRFLSSEDAKNIHQKIRKNDPQAWILDDREFELWEIRNGLPRYGTDVTEENLILEVPFLREHAVSFTKGCFVGQEPVARVHSRGGAMNRKLSGLVFSGMARAENEDLSQWKQASLSLAEGQGSEVVGQLKRAAFTDKEGVVFAVGMIKRVAYEDGAEVKVKVNGKELRGKVKAFPL